VSNYVLGDRQLSEYWFLKNRKHKRVLSRAIQTQRASHYHDHGDKVNPTEQIARSASTPKTSFSATLRDRLHVKGTGASSARRAAHASLLALGLLVAATTPALALEVHTYHASFGSEGAGNGQFKAPAGVAVSEVGASSGNVYVVDRGNNRVQVFNSEGTYLSQFNGSGLLPGEGKAAGSGGLPGEIPTGTFSSPQWVAVDNSTNPLDPSVGDVYVTDNAHSVIDKFSAAGTYLGQITTRTGGSPLENVFGVAVDAEGEVWVYEESGEIDNYGNLSPNEFLASRNSPFGTSPGFAVDSEDNLYVNRGSELIGKINSTGEPLIEELGSEQTTAAAVDTANNNVYVDNVSSIGAFSPAGALDERFGAGHLTGGTGVAVNASSKTVYAADGSADAVRVFNGLVVAAVIEGESISNIGATAATVSARINPGGLPTTYRVEYGPTIAYGSATPEVSVGGGSQAAGVQVQLSGLQAGSTYHARITASNELGTEPGGDLTFTTAASGTSASTLPDNRVYELVSPPDNNQVYVPFVDIPDGAPLTVLYTGRPSRASADGNAVAYVAEPPASGGSGSQGAGEGESYQAARTPQGWTASDIIPPGATLITQYAAFSSDLSVGVLEGLKTAGAAPCNELFARKDGLLQAFFTEQLSGASCGDNSNEPSFDGASADYSHLLYENQAALVPGAEEAGFEQYNLYDSVSGRLALVNVLPDGKPAPNATFGGPVSAGSQAAGFTNAISSDGSRIFWTDLNTGRLYLRINGTVTVPVSAGAAPSEFWTATLDGRYAFYTEGEGSTSRLWRFAVDRFEESTKPEAQALMEAREELTGEGAGVLGVIGVNETGQDGAYVYFVAEEILAPNSNSTGDTAIKGAPNLYVRDSAGTTFIATLALADNHISQHQAVTGDWQHNLGHRASEVTPDGHSVGFVSSARLTGFDSRGVNEVYVYDSASGQLACASCNPSGSAPVSGALVPATFANNSHGGGAYLARWLSDDGSRVFFDTQEPLLPQVTDGQSNVYEWERQGKGSCAHSPGCVYLLSGGGSPDGSYLVDAGANGNDVFFASRERLNPQARNEAMKLYDARVDGGFPENSTACTGTGCQGVPPAPPAFATPASVTFNGAGNFQAPTPETTKKKTAAQVRAEKLSKALRACRKKPKRKRAACNRQAKRQYAPVKKKGQR
jgi:hypothetical protein